MDASSLMRHHRTMRTSADNANHTRHDLDAVQKRDSLYGMDETKLTIRIDRATLASAKKYAQAHGTSLTRLVTSHLERLGGHGETADEAPVTRRLTGVLPPEASLHDYHEHIERTHA